MKKLLRRDLMYLYTSVFSAGIRNIAVQMFFDSRYPDKKETLVSVALFISALCTMFGIMLSSKLIRSTASVWSSTKSKLCLTAGMSLAVCISFAAMFIVRTTEVYMLLFGISSFCLNFMYNVFDVFISGTVKDDERERNVRILLTYQMIGYIAGPLFFSFCAGSPQLCIILSVLLLLICYLPVGRAYVVYTGHTFRHRTATASGTGDKEAMPERKEDQYALLYSFMMFCATNTLMPSVAYIMKDYLHTEGYAVKSSLFLAGTVLVSAVVIGVFPAMKLWKQRRAGPLFMGAALAMIIIVRSSSAPMLTVAALLSGAGNGIFLSGSRYYVNTAGAERGMVGRYNRIMTEATLIGYMIAALISWACIRNGITVVPAKLTAIMLMLGAAVFFASSRMLPGEKQRR